MSIIKDIYFTVPDHVFNNRWQKFNQTENKAYRGITLKALTSLANEFVVIKYGKPSLKLDTFGDWQNQLTRLSGLPILVAAKVQLSPQIDNAIDLYNGLELKKEFWSDFFGASPIAHPWNGIIEDYIEREGLHENHVHLNGSTYAEICWQRALVEPDNETRDFEKALNEPEVKELFHLVDPHFKLSTLRRRLKLAKNLRLWLTHWAYGTKPQLDQNKRDIFLDSDSWTRVDKIIHSFWPDRLDYIDQAHQKEALWLNKLFLRLQQKPEEIVDRFLHVYLLIQNQYLQLLVQRDDLYGFDQFNRFATTDLREQAEKDYLLRFKQANGKNNNSTCVFYEGRFAPKNDLKKNFDILSRIMSGYAKYLEMSIDRTQGLRHVLENLENRPISPNPRQIQLALVAHFIKKSWDYNKKQSWRYSELRNTLKKQASYLCEILRREPYLKRYIVGIDGAGNELQASPEVFAPIFRICKRAGLHNRTYHIGEDFYHLVGGIRQIADAVSILELSSGDRIGHATAIGIHPQLWLETMPNEILVTRGDWMLDLLCAWYYFSQKPDCLKWAIKAQTEAITLATQIFKKNMSFESLKLAMDLRGLWPEYVNKAVEDNQWNPNVLLDDNWREEGRLVAKHIRSQQLEILNKWLTDDRLWQISEEKIQVAADFFPEEALIVLQQQVMEEIVKKGITIETLPTSNVRISQYNHIREHHVFRWMKVPQFTVEGDPDLQICLGSDDPGIFATNIHNEFYHLFSTLMVDFKMSDSEALSLVAKVNERGRQYRFHPRL